MSYNIMTNTTKHKLLSKYAPSDNNTEVLYKRTKGINMFKKTTSEKGKNLFNPFRKGLKTVWKSKDC